LKVRLWRVWSAALIGACYVIFMFFPDLSFMYTFVIKGLFSLAMVIVAFGFISLQHMLRNLGAFYLVNFAAAGGIFAIHYLFESSGEVMNGMMYSRSGGMAFQVKIGLLFIIAIFFLMIVFYKSMLQSMRKTEQFTKYIAEVEVWLEGCQVTCTGLIDTGNRLYDPLSRSPVMIMEARLWQGALSEDWLARIHSSGTDEWMAAITEDDSFPWPDRIRLVPYKGIQKGSSFMLALKPDKVIIRIQNAVHLVDKALIGLHGGELSSDGSYRAIIHPGMVQSHLEQGEAKVS